MDSIPVASQLKSFVQFVARDQPGARRTQENFSKRCFLVSQIRSAVEAILGDKEAARMTQLEFVNELSGLIDGIPVVGHAKGAVHYALHDRRGGDDAMRSASRSTGVLMGGIGGALAGGVVGGPLGLPIGAVSGAIAGGAAMDGITTGVESAIKKKFCPSGIVHVGREIKRNPTNAGLYVDAVGMVALDAVNGYGVTIASRMATNQEPPDLWSIPFEPSLATPLSASSTLPFSISSEIITPILFSMEEDRQVEVLIDTIESAEEALETELEPQEQPDPDLSPEDAHIAPAVLPLPPVLKRVLSTKDPESETLLGEQDNLMVLKVMQDDEPVYVMLRIDSVMDSPDNNDPNCNAQNTKSALKFELTDIAETGNNIDKTNDIVNKNYILSGNK